MNWNGVIVDSRTALQVNEPLRKLLDIEDDGAAAPGADAENTDDTEDNR